MRSRANAFDALVALGAVVRGETPHFEFVAGECARGVMDVQLATGTPIGFGVLTTENLEQARERAAPEGGDKGYSARSPPRRCCRNWARLVASRLPRVTRGSKLLEDKILTCKECGTEFTFSAREQQFFAEKGFSNQPQRCRDCRQARRTQGGDRGAARRAESPQLRRRLRANAASKLPYHFVRAATGPSIAAHATRQKFRPAFP